MGRNGINTSEVERSSNAQRTSSDGRLHHVNFVHRQSLKQGDPIAGGNASRESRNERNRNSGYSNSTDFNSIDGIKRGTVHEQGINYVGHLGQDNQRRIPADILTNLRTKTNDRNLATFLIRKS